MRGPAANDRRPDAEQPRLLSPLQRRAGRPGGSRELAGRVQLAQHRPRAGRNRRRARQALHRARKASIVEWAPFMTGRAAGSGACRAGRPNEPLELPFASIWRHDRAETCRSTKRRLHGRDRGRHRRRSVAADALPNSSALGRDEQLRAFRIPLPTLFSFGLAGALSIRPPGSGAHIAIASSTLEVGAQPGGLGLGAGQDRRHPVVDLGDDLVRGRGHDRAAVEPAVVEAAVLRVLPLLAGADARRRRRARRRRP